MIRRGGKAASTLWAATAMVLLLGPAALAHTTGGNRDNWGSHPFASVAPNYDPIGTSQYTTNVTGTHNVWVTNSSCPGPGDTMRIRVVHEIPFAPDEFFGPQSFACGQTTSRNYGVPSDTGNFHLDIAKASGGGDTWSATGHTHYP